ncbi:MAG: NADPH-dependent glutamate synthase [Deferrisomatales bacterium]
MAKRERLPRTPMPEQDPLERARNFDEVPYGYTPEMAQREASRCLQCKKPACRKGCPVQVFIPEFIAAIGEGEFQKAAEILKEKNSLPAVCGRVCPQESQCEAYCVVGKKDEPVAIGRLERFAADWERAQGEVKIPELPPKTGKRVAVVGAGPAGLTVAGDLIRKGHEVTVFEALHKPGGVLVYGIPEFRLPKAIVQAEVDYLQKMGVRIECNAVIGKSRTVHELFEEDGFDAVFVGSGAGLPRFMGIPGENYNGVYSANEYLTRSNLMKAYLFPQYDTPIVRGKRVAVLGGGNVAMDAARTALRLGAEASIIVYRRGREEMPARNEEIHHAEEEGVEFKLLTNPTRILGDDNGWVRGMECVAMELGEPDESGRRRPQAVAGSEFVLDVDTVVVAIGNSPNPLIPNTTPEVQTTKWGTVVADEETGATTMKGVYAGGDVVTGAATVILAMGAGRKAADAIHDYLMGA